MRGAIWQRMMRSTRITRLGCVSVLFIPAIIHPTFLERKFPNPFKLICVQEKLRFLGGKIEKAVLAINRKSHDGVKLMDMHMSIGSWIESRWTPPDH